MGFLNTSCVTLIQTIPRIWEKWIRTVRKKYGKHKHLKVKGLWNFLLEAEIHAVPNMWEKWISIIRGKYGKTQTFQIYGFPKNFGWSRNPYNSQNMGKVNSYKYGKSMGKKTNIPKFLKYFGWSRNPYNTQNMEKVNSQTFQSSVLLNFFAWCRNLCSSQNMGKVDFHYTEKVWKNTNISNLWVF